MLCTSDKSWTSCTTNFKNQREMLYLPTQPNVRDLRRRWHIHENPKNCVCPRMNTMSKNRKRNRRFVFEIKMIYAVYGAHYGAFGLRLFNTRPASPRDASPQFFTALPSSHRLQRRHCRYAYLRACRLRVLKHTCSQKDTYLKKSNIKGRQKTQNKRTYRNIYTLGVVVREQNTKNMS